MNPEEIAQLRDLMEFEAGRKEPPAGFPPLPDIPGGRYTDPRFHQLEKQHIWRKSWLLASHMDELPEPGCFRLWEKAGQPVLIVHAENGRINAFYNTCSHRGAPIVTQTSGKRARLVCKYHGWTYNHDGQLLAVRDPQDFRGLDFSCRGLQPIRCERFGNLIFVNFDLDAPTLLEWLGPIADEWAEFQFDNCRLAARHSFALNCNWKIAMEANTEVYHVRSIHPKTVFPILDDRRNVNTLYPNGHGAHGGAHASRADNLRAVRFAENVAEIPTVGEIARTCTQSYGIFPNWGLPIKPPRSAAAAVLAQRHQQVHPGDLDPGARLGRWRKTRHVDGERRRKPHPSADRRHRVWRMDTEVRGVLRLQGRAAKLPRGPHLPLEPSRRPHDRHRQTFPRSCGWPK